MQFSLKNVELILLAFACNFFQLLLMGEIALKEVRMYGVVVKFRK